MIFMGTYSGDRDGSSTDDTTDEQPDERPEDQPGLDDFDEPRDETSDGEGDTGVPVRTVPGSAGGGPKEPVVEEQDDIGEPELKEEEHESEDDDEDDEKDKTVTVAVTVDPLSATSWGIQPVLQCVQAYYGDQVEVEYQVAPVRTFDDPEAVRTEWEESTTKHSMPVDTSLWDDPPESTELLNRSVLAAKEQGATEAYLRALWIEGIAAGQNLSDEDALLVLADNMGLDIDKFNADMESVEVDTDSELDELPITEVPIRGYTQRWTGIVHYADFKQQFIFEGLDEMGPGNLIEFVDAYGPVETEEVLEVYGREGDLTVEQLRDIDGIYSLEIGEGTYWVTE